MTFNENEEYSSNIVTITFIFDQNSSDHCLKSAYHEKKSPSKKITNSHACVRNIRLPSFEKKLCFFKCQSGQIMIIMSIFIKIQFIYNFTCYQFYDDSVCCLKCNNALYSFSVSSITLLNILERSVRRFSISPLFPLSSTDKCISSFHSE